MLFEWVVMVWVLVPGGGTGGSCGVGCGTLGCASQGCCGVGFGGGGAAAAGVFGLLPTWVGCFGICVCCFVHGWCNGERVVVVPPW